MNSLHQWFINSYTRICETFALFFLMRLDAREMKPVNLELIRSFLRKATSCEENNVKSDTIEIIVDQPIEMTMIYDEQSTSNDQKISDNNEKKTVIKRILSNDEWMNID